MKNRFLALDNKVEIVSKKLNENGYLVIKCIFARIGIQERYGAEINQSFEPTKLYREYRSPDEVFKPIVLESFRNVVITNDHPQEGTLTPQNTKYHAIGFVSSTVEVVDSSYLACEITIYDEKTIDDIQNGKVELSAGYLYSILMVEHEDYDYIQTDIKPNHIAIVQAGRCGSVCSIALDSSNSKQGKTMKIIFKVMLPGGSEKIISEIEVSEENAEAVQGVADTVFEMSKAKCDANNANDEDMQKLQDELKAKDEIIDKLQAEVDSKKDVATDSKAVHALALDFSGVMSVASSCGVEIVANDMTATKKAVIAKVNSDLALDGKSDAYIATAYDICASQLKNADASFLKALDFKPEKGLDEKQKKATVAKDGFNSKYGGNS